jgi:hypothetical protein
MFIDPNTITKRREMIMRSLKLSGEKRNIQKMVFGRSTAG